MLNRRILIGTLAALAGDLPVTKAQPRGEPLRIAQNEVTMSELKYVEVNGARLAYEHRAGSGQRAPLVFLHGYALRSSGPIYNELLEPLQKQFDVYALDMRGHGGSASSFTNWSQATIADDVAAFVETLGLRGAVYAGHSLGGFTGMYAQIRHPGTFSALCLLATAAASGGVAPPGLETYFTESGHNQAQMRDTFATMYKRPTPHMLQMAAEAVGVIDPAVHQAFYPNYARVIIADRLAEIDIPVLLVSGGKDNVVAPAEQHKTALGLSKHKEVTFSGEGHMLPLEASAMTAREIINFCRYDVPELFT